MIGIFNLIGEVVGVGRDYLAGRRKVKQAKVEGEIAINTTKVENQQKRLNTVQKADIAWEDTSLKQSGWKDDYWTLVLSVPLMMCFVPVLVDYAMAGFVALEQTPLWYRVAVGTAIGSAFGTKSIVNFMRIKKGD